VEEFLQEWLEGRRNRGRSDGTVLGELHVVGRKDPESHGMDYVHAYFVFEKAE
jgi:hypothetical protein